MFYGTNKRITISDFARKVKRTIDVNLSYRKLFFLVILILIFLVYIGPLIIRKIFGDTEIEKGKQTFY